MLCVSAFSESLRLIESVTCFNVKGARVRRDAEKNFRLTKSALCTHSDAISETDLFLILLFVACAIISTAQTPNSEWHFYGGDEGGTRYSNLKQINRTNVTSLKRAWTYQTGELQLGLTTAPFPGVLLIYAACH